MKQPEYLSESTVTLLNTMGDDTTIAGAAWVSTSGADCINKAVQETDKKVAGLINYLMSQRHGSPFEHGIMQFYVHTPIFVWREHHRHRIASYNEESARYKQLDPVFYIPDFNRPMIKVEDWKAGRPKFVKLTEYFKDNPEQLEHDTPEKFYMEFKTDLIHSYNIGYTTYNKWLKNKVDPGLTRDCLPVGIFSGCWVTMNLRSLMNFISLRTHDETASKVSYPLYEIEQVALKYEGFFKAQFPMVHEAFVKNGRVAP